MKKNRYLTIAAMFLTLIFAVAVWSQEQPGQAQGMGGMYNPPMMPGMGHGQMKSQGEDAAQKPDQPSGGHQMGGMQHGGGMGCGMCPKMSGGKKEGMGGGMCPKMSGGKMEGMGGGMMKKGMMESKMGRREKMGKMPSGPDHRGAKSDGYGLMGPLHNWVKKMMAHRQTFGFTPDQMKQFDEAISGHFASAVRSHGEIKALKVELNYALRSKPDDLAGAEALLRKIGDQTFQQQMEGVRAYGRLLQILTPAQKEKVEDMLGNPFAPPWKKKKPMAGPHHRMGGQAKTYGSAAAVHSGHDAGPGGGHEMRHGEEQPEDEEFFEEMEDDPEMEHGTEKAQRM